MLYDAEGHELGCDALLSGASGVRTYYFAVRRSALRSLASQACIATFERAPPPPPHVHGAMELVRLRWDAVAMLGTPEQKRAFNKMRMEYVAALLGGKGVCGPRSGRSCTAVGTVPPSPVSDMDFNVAGPSVADAIAEARRRHHARLEDPIDVVFDVNLYAAISPLGPACPLERAACSQRSARIMASPALALGQRAWSFLRIAHVLDAGAHCLQMLPCHRAFVERAGRLKRRLDKKLKGLTPEAAYALSVRETARSARSAVGPARIAYLFGQSKHLERDTYRSVGAVLDIVYKLDPMPTTLMYDSVYDNFGFALHALLHERCSNMDVRLLEASKYVDRICRTLRRIRAAQRHASSATASASASASDDRLERLAELSDRLNAKRKQLEPATHAEKAKLAALLGDPHALHDASSAARAVYRTLLVDLLPPDPACARLRAKTAAARMVG